VFRFEVRSGDVWSIDPATKNRSELCGSAHYAPGVSVGVSYSFEVEPGPTSTAQWLVAGQFHQIDSNGYSPPFEINFNGGDKMGVSVNYLLSGGGQAYKQLWTDSAAIVRGQVYSMYIKAKFDQGEGSGSLLVMRDGVTVVNYTGPMGFPGMSGTYWKEGVYRAAAPETTAMQFKYLDVD
jgi:hypothetical protein